VPWSGRWPRGSAAPIFFAATGTGWLTVVVVLTALYPAITVLLAAIVLQERAGRNQLVGLVISSAAMALFWST
jgi:uncharacterized membrane protein